MSSAKEIETLVKQLRAASDAYYNGGAAIMGDDAFDAAVERLRSLQPNHPFLAEIGAPPAEGAVALPTPMPSLDKIKPGEDRLHRFLTTAGSKGVVVSEKLDGLSALWIPARRQLLLRGDGLKGQDISHLVDLGIQGLRSTGGILRGEILLRRTEGIPLARSWVNGLVHRKDPDAASVARIHFVAYEVLDPAGLSREQQFTWLAANGYETPWWVAQKEGVREQELAAWLLSRRNSSPYETDGLVVGWNTVPKSESTAVRCRNPKDCVAFKMPLEEQSAETVVEAIEWGTSAQGYLIPTLKFQPVQIGAATIQYCTGHNAKMIQEGRIGPGARIRIRRSGDVIPKLDAVLVPAAIASLPPAGTWEWDATQTHIRLLAGTSGGKELSIAKLEHFLRSLEIPGCGPATATALVEAGILGPAALYATPAAKLSEILGPKTGASLYSNFRKALGSATEKGLMVASSQMPRGVGDTKLTALFARDSDPRRWRVGLGCDAPAGWTTASLTSFWPALGAYEEWRKRELSWIPYPILPTAMAAVAAAPAAPAAAVGVLCMTGFRDKDLETAAAAAGWTTAAGVTSKVTMLLVADGPLKESEKVKAAREKQIPILTRSAFLQQYLGRR